MYRVLLPVDTNEERAGNQANYVANLPDAAESVEATILYVFDDDDSLDPSDDESARSAEDIESVQRAIDHFEEHGVDWEAIKDRGDPTQAILSQADNHDPQEIVLGGRKRSPAGKVLFGSVTMSVLRETEIPVVITGKPSS